MAEKRWVLREILELDNMFRRYLINTVEGFKNAALIGTVDSLGVTNLAMFNSVIHIGATPPLIGFIHRPVSIPKQTLTNIQTGECFTINLIHREILEQAHQASARYSPGVSEFEATGLTPWFGKVIRSPYVKESRIRFGLSLEDIQPIRANGTFLVIGQVEEMFVPEEIVGPDGFTDLTAAGILACAGLDSYYRPEPVGRFDYAKPGRKVKVKKP